MSPVTSFGTKEYGCPHLVQNPSVLPGLSPRERPTCAPQSDREQKRFRSGTSGCSITADRGSGRGTSGTETRPAPSRLRADELADAPELRTDTERADVRPDTERESRPETDLREVEERDDERADARDDEPLRADELSLPRPARVTPVGGELTLPVGETTGASPQTPQYSSPPPMSS